MLFSIILLALHIKRRAMSAKLSPVPITAHTQGHLAAAIIKFPNQTCVTMSKAAAPKPVVASTSKADQLIEAVRSQDMDSVAALLEMGADVNALGSLGLTALIVAAEQGSSCQIVRSLLDAGADANLVSSNGTTPLRSALLSGDGETIEMLIQLGNADVNMETSRGTPLTTACCEGDVDGVKLLLSHGAAISYETRDGLTALMIATREDKREVVRVLLQHGAEPDQKSQYSGKTALDIAEDKVLPEVVSLLMQHTITTAADAAIHDVEARQRQGMQEAKDRLVDDQQKLKEESVQSNQQVAARIAELQAEGLELKRKLGLIK